MQFPSRCDLSEAVADVTLSQTGNEFASGAEEIAPVPANGETSAAGYEISSIGCAKWLGTDWC